jgi:hypothetical protein
MSPRVPVLLVRRSEMDDGAGEGNNQDGAMAADPPAARPAWGLHDPKSTSSRRQVTYPYPENPTCGIFAGNPCSYCLAPFGSTRPITSGRADKPCPIPYLDGSFSWPSDYFTPAPKLHSTYNVAQNDEANEYSLILRNYK